MQTLERRLKEYENLYDNSKIFRMRTDGVGVYSASDAINWGVTGPNLRSSGVPFDLRQTDSYDAYPELDFKPVTNTAAGGGSDCFSRYRQRVDEMHQSMDLVRQALAKMPKGKVMSDSVPLRASGEAFRRTEDSRGEALMYLVGDGSDRPYRWKIRSPMFTTVSAAPHFLKGYKVADVPAIMDSIDMCIGETDK